MTELTCEETLNQLLFENKSLTDKIKALLQESSNTNLYIINLEKQIIDLEFQLHQINLMHPINLNYKHKYKQIMDIMYEIEEFKLFCSENKIKVFEDNYFTKLISYMDQKKKEKDAVLLDELKENLSKKENLIENLNKILAKNEENFAVLTEQMKSQINYLIGLLNVKSEEDKNKKLLEVVKILTSKNNELLRKDETCKWRIELERKNKVIETLLSDIEELKNIKSMNEKLKDINEQNFISARESELNSKGVLLEMEILKKKISLLEEQINLLKVENDTLSQKNKSLIKISENLYEKEKEMEVKQNELLSKEILLEGLEKNIKEKQKHIKNKNRKIRNLKEQRKEDLAKINKLEENNHELSAALKECVNEKEAIQNSLESTINESISNYKIDYDILKKENMQLTDIIKEKDLAMQDLLNKSTDSTLEMLGKEKYLLTEENNKLYKKIKEIQDKSQTYMQNCIDLSNELKYYKEKDINSIDIQKYNNEIAGLKLEIESKNDLIKELEKNTGDLLVKELKDELEYKNSIIQKLNLSLDRLKDAYIKLKETTNKL